MSEQRKGIPVRYDKSKIQGEAHLYIRGPQSGWKRKKSGPNDGEFLVSFPDDFEGERDAIVVGSEGGLANVRITVK